MEALREAFRGRRFSTTWEQNKSELLLQRPLQPFVLPSALPAWPTGTGFATGNIVLGDITLAQISAFEQVWSASEGGINNQGATFFKPINLPADYSCLGYYCQPNNGPLEGWILVAKESCRTSPITSDSTSSTKTTPPPTTTPTTKREDVDHPGDTSMPAAGDPAQVPNDSSQKTALASPVGYTLVWNSTEWNEKTSGPGYFWLPSAPDGYNSLGYVVTKTAETPSMQEVVCVRSDLTDVCRIKDSIWGTDTNKSPFNVWNLMPPVTGTEAKGIPVGTFFCSNTSSADSIIPIACLKNADLDLSSMPSLDQVHALIRNYGPTIFFHPDEMYLPSSVSWFFGMGALLYSQGETAPEKIALDGSNLPIGGTDDGEYWIDLPNDGTAEEVKKGDLSNAEVYIHVKPMLGGTFTDLATWIYYPFNGAATAKVGLINVGLGKIGEHVSDWEHFTLRISNFTGKLWKIYFSQHSGGTWIKASELEYIEGTKGIIYSSNNGHASYPHPGLVLQGDHGVGIRNDTARSNYSLDCSKNYQIISAEYLHTRGNRNALEEPKWLQYMRKWGPQVQYDSRAELDKVLHRLPPFLRSKLQSLVKKFPDELSDEEGPTGPKQKNNWFGDERE